MTILHHLIASGAILGLCACLACLAGVYLYRTRNAYRHGFARVGLIILAIVAIARGGSKPTPVPSMKITSASADVTVVSSIATNDDVTIVWKYAEVAANDTLYIDVRDKGTTNEWERVYSGGIQGNHPVVFDDDSLYGGYAGVISDAANRECVIWTEYHSPIIIVTNGVYHLNARSVMNPDYTASTNRFITNTELRKE